VDSFGSESWSLLSNKPKPERPLENRPGNDCNRLVTGRRLGNPTERRHFDFMAGGQQHEAAKSTWLD
jgi:hypothetical protein